MSIEKSKCATNLHLAATRLISDETCPCISLLFKIQALMVAESDSNQILIKSILSIIQDCNLLSIKLT